MISPINIRFSPLNNQNKICKANFTSKALCNVSFGQNCDSFERKTKTYQEKREILLKNKVISNILEKKYIGEPTIHKYALYDDDKFAKVNKLINNKNYAHFMQDACTSNLWCFQIPNLVEHSDEEIDRLLKLIDNKSVFKKLDSTEVSLNNILPHIKGDKVEFNKLMRVLSDKNIQYHLDNFNVKMNFLLNSYCDDDEVLDRFLDVSDKTVNVHDAYNIAINKDKSDAYDEYSKKYNRQIASILANVTSVKTFGENNVSQVAKTVIPFAKAGENISQLINKFYDENSDINFEDFAKYSKELDLIKISDLAPVVKDFSAKNMLTFMSYHYQNGRKTNFLPEDLIYKKNLTNFLRKNYLCQESLDELLSAFPLTLRQIGKVPFSWMRNLEQNERQQGEQNFYNAILNFQQTQDIKHFQTELSEIEKQDVKVKNIGDGAYGTCYKLSTDGGEDICLKIFKPFSVSNKQFINEHGQHIEPQTAIFMSNNFDNIVEFLFGKVAGTMTEDGFYATKFLERKKDTYKMEDIIRLSRQEKDKFSYYAYDLAQRNLIENKIIDFGSIDIRDEDRKKIIWSVMKDSDKSVNN